MKVNFGKPADMRYKTLNVITLPSGAVVYSHEHKTYESWLAAQTPSFQQLSARNEARRERIWGIIQKQATQPVRKPIFDRRAVQQGPTTFGQMVAAEMQKASL